MTASTSMPVPPYTAEEAHNRETFLALMWSLSYPGRIYDLKPGENASLFATVGASLLDLETSYFTPDAALDVELRRTSARLLPAERAAYHFYPVLDSAHLDSIAVANRGSAQFPDEAATLFIGCAAGTLNGEPDPAGVPVTRLILHGPGIQGEAHLRFAGVPQAMWDLRERTRLYPIGWDIFLVDPSGKVTGLPRSVAIEIEN